MDKALIEKMNSSSALRERPGRQTGTVKFFNTSKGYGFIAADGGADMFVHASGVITPPLATGDAVEYWVSTNERNGKTKAIRGDLIALAALAARIGR